MGGDDHDRSGTAKGGSMKKKTSLYVVPREIPKRAMPSVTQINRTGVYQGDIVAFVACLSFDARDAALPCDSMRLAEALRTQLYAIAGQLPDAAFLAIASICGELLNDGAQAMLANHLANIAVIKAKKGGK
jgi:hypothetical protein